MKCLLTGATGFVGSALSDALKQRGDHVTVLTRSGGSAPNVHTWNPDAGELDAAAVAGFDAIIHLAGESILGVWTHGKRRRIRESRVKGTELLVRKILELHENERPQQFLSASAVGYYGSRREELLTEAAPPGNG